MCAVAWEGLARDIWREKVSEQESDNIPQYLGYPWLSIVFINSFPFDMLVQESQEYPGWSHSGSHSAVTAEKCLLVPRVIGYTEPMRTRQHWMHKQHVIPCKTAAMLQCFSLIQCSKLFLFIRGWIWLDQGFRKMHLAKVWEATAIVRGNFGLSRPTLILKGTTRAQLWPRCARVRLVPDAASCSERSNTLKSLPHFS